MSTLPDVKLRSWDRKENDTHLAIYPHDLIYLKPRKHTEKHFIYLRQKQGRNMHPEKRAGILLNKECAIRG